MDTRTSEPPRQDSTRISRTRAARTQAARLVARSAVVASLLTAAGCFGGGATRGQASVTPDGRAEVSSRAPGGSAGVTSRTYATLIPVSHPPFDEFHANWMQRLDQPYVFIDCYGHYGDATSHIPMILREAAAQGLEVSGAPFALFYDDPAETPVAELRSRVCLPISGPAAPKAPLAYDVLPSQAVVHAYVTGPYPDAPTAYPKLLEYMRQIRKAPAGPIREIYIVQPAAAETTRDLLCEIQIPFRAIE